VLKLPAHGQLYHSYVSVTESFRNGYLLSYSNDFSTFIERLRIMTMFTKTKQLVPIVREMNLVCIVKLYLFQINFNIVFPSRIRSSFEVF